MPTPISKFFVKHDVRQFQQGIAELALEIQAQTLLQPIIVQPDGDDYEILDGRRRFYALRDHLFLSALEEGTHFIVRTGMEALVVQFAANQGRVDFTPVEEAALINEIHEKGVAAKGRPVKGVSSNAWSLSDTAKIIGRDKGFVSRMLNIHKNRKLFKEAKTKQECFDLIKKQGEKKVLTILKKKKIERAVKHEDIAELFNNVKCALAQDFIKEVESGTIDLIHVDPPFAINYDELITAEYDAKYEDKPDEIMAIIMGLIEEYYRVLKNDRYIILWCDIWKGYEIKKKMEEVGFTVAPTPIVWTKLSTAGKTHQPNIRLGSATQFALFAWKGIPELNIKGRHNYFPYPIVRSNRIHQAQMPEELIADLIKIFSTEGDIVLDTFSGSLTTLRACYATGRRFVGCELQEKNIENGKSYSLTWVSEKRKED